VAVAGLVGALVSPKAGTDDVVVAALPASGSDITAIAADGTKITLPVRNGIYSGTSQDVASLRWTTEHGSQALDLTPAT
jgi:hypothetical protein